LTEPNGGSAYRTTLSYQPDWFLTHSSNSYSSLVSRDVIDAGLGLDPALGAATFVATDCNPLSLLAGNNRGAGIQVTVSPAGASTHVYYTQNGSVNPAALATDNSGSGAIWNLAPGTVTIDTWRADTGEHIGTKTVLIRADTLTGVAVNPSP
jgi:hypothetical protein